MERRLVVGHKAEADGRILKPNKKECKSNENF